MTKQAEVPGLHPSIYDRSPEETEKVIQAARERAAGEMAILLSASPFSPLSPDQLPPSLVIKILRNWAFYTWDQAPMFAAEVINETAKQGFPPPTWAAVAVQPLMEQQLKGKTEKLNDTNYRMRQQFHKAFFDYYTLKTHFPEISNPQRKKAIQKKHGIKDYAWDSFRGKYRDQEVEQKFNTTAWEDRKGNSYWTPERRSSFLARFPDDSLHT